MAIRVFANDYYHQRQHGTLKKCTLLKLKTLESCCWNVECVAHSHISCEIVNQVVIIGIISRTIIIKLHWRSSPNLQTNQNAELKRRVHKEREDDGNKK